MTPMVYTNCTDHSLAYILHLCVTITVRDPLVSGLLAVPLGLCEIDLYHAAAILSPIGTKSFVFARPASH